MKLKRTIEKLIYLGHNKYTVEKYYNEIYRDNLKILIPVSIISSLFLLSVGIVLYIVNKDVFRALINIFLGFFMIAVGVISKNIYKGNIKVSDKAINHIIDFTSFCAYALGILCGTVKADNNLAVSIIWLFLFVQIMFNRLPLENLIVVPSAAVFIVLSFLTKDHSKSFYDTIGAVSVVGIGMYMSWVKSKVKLDCIILTAELKKRNEKLYQISTTDELTGLYNRKQILKKLEKVRSECENERCRMFCLVMDLDNFKAFNDIYGHPAGDTLLKKVGHALKSYCDDSGIYVGRIGGEEFLAVWKENKNLRPETAAENIRLSISDMNIPHKGSETSDIVTISQGMFIMDSYQIKDADPYYLADKALYEAKRQGKNRCCIA